MNIPEMYDYLIRARRDLWTTLKSLPDEVLSRPLLNGSRFHCIKDMVFHIAEVEDGWINMDILREQPVQSTIPALNNAGDISNFADFDLEVLLNYWLRVEQKTLGYIATLTDEELKRVVILHDSPDEQFSVDGLIWHVMIHEMRHSAQICMLLRMQDIKPPSLDLLFYLPVGNGSV